MPSRKKQIPKAHLASLYLEQRLSPWKIAEMLTCSETTIRKRLKAYGIPLRSRSQAQQAARGIRIERHTLENLYHDQQLNISQIATHLDCSEDTVRARMQAYRIATRTPAEAAQIARGIDLSQETARRWYIEQSLSMREIAGRLGCSETAVRNKLETYGISRRTPWAHNEVKIEDEELRRLYEEEHHSMESIAVMYGCSLTTIHRKLKALGIPARPTWRVHYARSDFSQDPLEKAYLVGFRLGDLTVRPAERCVEVLSTTTCQEQIDLIEDLFSPYGHVYEHKRPDSKVFQQVRLNATFKFLLTKEDRIPQWITGQSAYFFAFMAGYVDADGSIRTVGPHSARLDIQTYDQGILMGIWEGLTALDIYCAKPRVVVKAGYTNRAGITQNQDKWGLWIHRRAHVSQLLKHLLTYLKHRKRRKDALCALEATREE